MYGFVLFTILALRPFVLGYEIQPLTSYSWNVKNCNETFQLKGTVPGGIYTDLSRAGILNETIFYRNNDVKYRWVAYENWTYSVNFSVNQSNLPKFNELVFHGVDGHASFILNNVLLGQANNTFVRYRYDVSTLLKQNDNRLEVRFESPIVSGQRLAAQSGHPILPECVPPAYNGECHINHLRRMPASFGWDMGLAAPSVGLWKSVELLTYREDLIIRDVITSITCSDQDEWKVAIRVFCEGPLNADALVEGNIVATLIVENDVSITTSFGKISYKSKDLKNGEVIASGVLLVPKNKVNLWWPNGHGNQPLYNLSVTFDSDRNNSNAKTVLVGFREAKLVQDLVNASDPKLGRSFYFAINGVPIFAKGSNYIPHSIFLEEASNRTTINNLLSATKEANMNILRVWGGGVYADDYFYEQCDLLGIMVWQDMMFACSMYPSDPGFLANVRNEIGQQIKRLQHHASIVVWAGNNENEGALRGNWYNTNSSFEEFKKEYVELYVNTIKDVVAQFDGTRTFLVSSPTNGVQSETEGYIAQNPSHPLYGDVHYYYDYLDNAWLSDSYPMTRFASEYGSHSLPFLSSLRQVAMEADLRSLETKFFINRQHGYPYLKQLIELSMYFPDPKLDDLANIIYLTHVNQAWTTKLQTEWYRKWRTEILPSGAGQTMGAMYWQLNELWQGGPSLSSLEFDGKWKMLHYYAKKFFAPVIITAHQNSIGNISVSIVSDLLEDLPDVDVNLTIFSWSSWTPVFSIKDRVTVKNGSAVEFLKTNVEELLETNPKCKSGRHDRNNKCFIQLELIKSKSGELIHDNFLFPSLLKFACGVQPTKIQVKVESCTDAKVCTLKVKASTISLFVWLDTKNDHSSGHFSDNGFVMARPERTVQFYADRTISVDQLQASITITVLNDSEA